MTTAGLSLDKALKRPQIFLEIGCGVGWHPIQEAQKLTQNSNSGNASLAEEAAIIAIERTVNKFASFKNRLNNHVELTRIITAVNADAIYFITHYVKASSVDKLWLLYPNPEVKKQNNRWYLSPGFKEILKSLKPNGEFYFATNLKEYAASALKASSELNLNLNLKRVISAADDSHFKPRSHFEKKYLERGDLIYDFSFRKL